MEDDVDIYADLSSFGLNPEKNDQDCNCKELKKELSAFVSKLENIQTIKINLEKNLSSLLKTAKAEIARKDKMINDLRQQLDNVTFRRGNKSDASGFSTHRLAQHTVKYENTVKSENVPSTHSQENETESHQVQFHQDENKSRKPQIDVNRISTLFGERLQKRIMENEKEEKKQKALLEPNLEVKTKETMLPKNNVENDKENGSQFSINNTNDSNIGRCSNSEASERNPYKNNLTKRANEEDDTHRHKRLKIENNEDKTTTEETDYNNLIRHNLTDNPAQYKMKYNLVKFENQPNAAHSFKKEEVPVYTGRRAASEYRDTKQDQSCINGLRNDVKNNSAKDHDGSNIRNDLADSLRNSRTASTSNHVSEGFNSRYKKNDYRYSPPRRSYSRSRSDYESLSSRLRERSSRIYKEKKYDDYKYDSRYKNGRLKRNESEENGKPRYKRGERGVLRDRSRYSSSDAEDRESSSSYKNKKYENRRIKKKETANVSNDKKLYESKAAAKTNFRESSSRTIINSTTNYNVGKNIEQHKIKNELEIKSENSIKSMSARVATKYLDILEEGEILDSPEKKNNSAKISKDNKMEENNVKSVPVEDKNEHISVNISIDDKSILFQKDANNSTKQLEVADISTKKIEVASCLLHKNLKDCGKVIQLNSSKNNIAVNEIYNCRKDEDACKSYINEDLMDSIAQNIGAIEQVRDIDSDIDGNDKNDADKASKDFIIENTKNKGVTASNIESVTKIKELVDSNIESVTKKEEMDNLNIESVIEITEVNNCNINSPIHKIDGDELRTSTAKVVTKVEAVLNCDIEDRDKSQAPIKNKIFHQMSNKSNVEMCLNDHNYVQNPFITVSALDATQKPSLRSKCDEAVPKTITSKETKAEKIINVQSINGVKRTMSSVVKYKKDQQSKGIVISHRRKAVILSDSNASMTILMNTNIAKTSSIINNYKDNDTTLKPRACKISRVTAKATCK